MILWQKCILRTNSGIHTICHHNLFGVSLQLCHVPFYMNSTHSTLRLHRGGSKIFFRRGCTRLLLYFNTNKAHSFFAEYQLYWKTASHPWGGGGVRTTCTLPLDPPLLHILFLDPSWLVRCVVLTPDSELQIQTPR